MASFPLVPYANRIAHGRFEWAGRELRVPLNFSDHPHALHALGWQAAWEVVEHEAERVLLRHGHHGGPGWPWAYDAEQQISLSKKGLEARLRVTNRGDEAAPFGLGFHPYFEAPPGTLLRTRVSNVWLADETCVPERRTGGDWFSDWSDGASVHRDELIDHCFTDWNGAAEVIRPDLGTIRVTASPELSNLHLYMPPGSSFFCAEPVSHMPNAINRADADEGERMHVLEPGETLGVAMRIEI
jgi:aldose 1-epimerase